MTKQTLTRKQKIAEFPQGFNLTVTGRHLHVTDAMKAYAREKVMKLEHVADRIIDIHVIMDIQKLAHNVEILMKYGHAFIKSHASTTDMYVSVDQAFDKLEARLLKYKSRLKAYHGKSYPLVQVTETIYRPVSEEAWESITEIDEGEANAEIEAANEQRLEATFYPHKIVKVEFQPVKMLSNDEAIMQMELSKSQAMVYTDIESNKRKVIYRREDGNYGVLGPV